MSAIVSVALSLLLLLCLSSSICVMNRRRLLVALYPLRVIPRPFGMGLEWGYYILWCMSSFSCLSVAGIPYDGIPRNKTVTVHLAVTVISRILATCGIIMTIVFLFFNLVFRERKWVVLLLYKCLLHACMCCIFIAHNGGLVLFSVLKKILHSCYNHTAAFTELV